MALYQVWEYGEGDGPRNTYEAVSEEQAMKAYLDRQLVSGKTYRDHLKADGVDRLLLCVKDPTWTGTPDDPNYPAVYTIDFGSAAVETSFEGTLVDGAIKDPDQSTVDDHIA